MPIDSPSAFLFAWNPVKYQWPEIAMCIHNLELGKPVKEHWSCASKQVKPGDRAFISLVGTPHNGIFASGYIASELFIGQSHRGTLANRVYIAFDTLLDPSNEAILGLDILRVGKLEQQLWTPQASGIRIKPDLLPELEAVWKDFLENHRSSGQNPGIVKKGTL